MTPKDAVKLVKDQNIEFVDLRFIDWPGMWQHFTVPVSEFSEESFEQGYGFDGSSIRGWQPINMSDMLVMPDAATAVVDPFYGHKTLVLICDILDPITKKPYTRDPRHIAKKAVNYLKFTGIGDTAYVGPECEFFLFDNLRYQVGPNRCFYELDSPEAHWNTGREGAANLAYKVRLKEGYFPVPPSDTLQDIRGEMVKNMQSVGIRIEAQHHEVASAGQCEIDMRFGDLVTMADRVMWYKYVVRNTARKHGLVANFMPKPIYGDNGSGMHCHQSIWKDGKPLFAGNGYAGMSDMAMYYIGGLIKHAKAIAALANPTTNSYKRLVPGYEAPVNLAYSSRNRSAAIRIPIGTSSAATRRLEFRCPDPSCNPYLAFAAMLLAGLDGIQNRMDPGEPLDKDIYSLSPEELREVPHTPGSLDEALQALREDHEFLLRGDVFTQDAIEKWVEYKYDNEVKPMAMHPHPLEFKLYSDI